MLELNVGCPLRVIPVIHCGPYFQDISLHRYPPDEIYMPHFPPAHLRPQFSTPTASRQATSPAAGAAGGAAAAAPPQQDQFFLSLLPAAHGIRAFDVPDARTYLAEMDATFSAHAISVAPDLDFAREACACLNWIRWPGRVTYAALPDTARQRLHWLLGLGSHATFDPRALAWLMAKAPGQHDPPALPAAAGAAGPRAAPTPPVRPVPSALRSRALSLLPPAIGAAGSALIPIDSAPPPPTPAGPAAASPRPRPRDSASGVGRQRGAPPPSSPTLFSPPPSAGLRTDERPPVSPPEPAPPSGWCRSRCGPMLDPVAGSSRCSNHHRLATLKYGRGRS
jgi:hypothetical protein